MTESASPMHGEAQGATAAPKDGRTCRWCRTTFLARRRWQQFCSSKCRNDWHSAARPAAVMEARELVRQVLAGEADPTVWNPRARRLLGVK